MKYEIDINRLILFGSVRDDQVCRRIAQISVASGTADTAYYEVQRILLDEIGRGEITGNVLQNHLCRLIAQEENTFTRMAEVGRFEGLGLGRLGEPKPGKLGTIEKAILELAEEEIAVLQHLYQFQFQQNAAIGAADAASVTGRATANRRFDATRLPAVGTDDSGGTCTPSRREAVHQALLKQDPAEAALALARYDRSFGSGILEAASAFLFDQEGLVPAERIDPITFEDLIGCEHQKHALIENASAQLRGLPANNVLLYGDSGTGKSSSVKALLNRFADQGMKLVSIGRDQLDRLPGALDAIAGRGMKFEQYADRLDRPGRNQRESAD
ncbi:hypothetical protein AGMMS49983_21800 [Clostridia bacterium]|nr:hypothetical protein AGMMS49983_21800 [Clostridia bacterium]